MGQYYSVVMIAARSTIYRLVAILMLMAGLESIFFYRLLKAQTPNKVISLEALVEESGMPLICGIAFLLLCIVLSLTAYEFSGSKMRYTIQRLSIKEERAVFLWGAYNAACLVIFWSTQTIVALLLCQLYIKMMPPNYWNEQTIFLAFYRSDFLHSLLPLAEISRWIRNGVLILTLGITAACFSLKQRRGKKGIAIVAMAILTFSVFVQDMGQLSQDCVVAGIALIVFIYSCYGVLWGQKYEN